MPPKRQRNNTQGQASVSSPLAYSESHHSSEDEADIDYAKPIVWGGKRYYRTMPMSDKKLAMKKTSSVWKYNRGFAMVLQSNTKQKFYYCRRCIDSKKDTTYEPYSQYTSENEVFLLIVADIMNGLTSVRNHWRNTHGEDDDGQPLAKGAITVHTRHNPLVFVGELHSHFVAFKQCLLTWLVFCHIAIFQLVNGDHFKEVIRAIAPAAVRYLPSRDVIRKWVLQTFLVERKKLRRSLKGTKSKIHISFDLWSSPNYHALIAVVAHYIDSKGERQQHLLAVRLVEGEHTGHNIAAVVLSVLGDYRIGKKIGFFVLDNAKNNDTAVDLILQALYPQMTTEQRVGRRLRCLGHVINLSAQKFILGQTAKKDLRRLDALREKGAFEKIEEYWRNKGPLGKLHNLVKHIRMTPQRRQEFKKCSVGSDAVNRLEVSNYLVVAFL